MKLGIRVYYTPKTGMIFVNDLQAVDYLDGL